MAEKPILVAGKSGQQARCLLDSIVLRNMPMVAVGRPELDLENGEGIDRVMAAVVYHLAGEGETSWHGFAAAIFASLARRGRRVPKSQAVTTADYPTPARRPKNSCLDWCKVEREFGAQLPSWRSSLEECLDQLEEMPKELRAC